MSAAFSGIILLILAGLMVFVLSRQETTRRSQYSPSGCSEFRTDLALDECMDRLNTPTDADLFEYTCPREPDGSFTLHLTMHHATQQPLDTLYSLRLDPGRQTVVTLIFLREAFGYKEPVFPPELLDRFFSEKLDAHRTR